MNINIEIIMFLQKINLSSISRGFCTTGGRRQFSSANNFSTTHDKSRKYPILCHEFNDFCADGLVLAILS